MQSKIVARQRRQAAARAEGTATATAKRLSANLASRPNRVTAEQISHLMSPLTTALIAFRLGAAGDVPYHDLAAALTVAYCIATRVERHRHTLPHIDAALGVLRAVFERANGADTYAAEAPEIEAIDLAVDVYRGLLHATPWSFLRRAISDAMPS